MPRGINIVHRSDNMSATNTATTAPRPKFNLNRGQVVDENFLAFVRSWPQGSGSAIRRDPQEPLVSGTTMTCRDAIELFESQVIARHQDLESRAMRARNEGFYTIGSAGHEGNAVVGRLTRHTDMAFLHYRSGAFMAERARKIPALDFTRDTMLSFAASREEPIAGGRHKVWGSVELSVPPQTSTIASQLPKAVGTALSLRRAHRLKVDSGRPADSIVVCSFGDASVNHAVAQTAFNASAWSTFQKIPMPILFVCEDNGIGISVPTPKDWIATSMSNRPGIAYFHANGLDLVDAHRGAAQAVDYCRAHQSPVFLHLSVVRMLAHAGSDAETEYHTWEEIESAEARDPLLATARLLLSEQAMTPPDLLELYESVRMRVRTASNYAVTTSKLTSAAEIVAPLAPYTPAEVLKESRRLPDHAERVRIFGGADQLPEKGLPRHMAVLINAGLHDLLIKYPQSLIFGEDVAKKGGVYHVTTGLTNKFGIGRVFNTLLDETTILGMAIGAGHVGLLPIPEIQYLAYYHNAEDQIRGEACSLQFFSNNQYRNPMVIRINGWGYQKGFGGHFHNDNSIAALRDVPSLIIATPSRGDDAVMMMRTLMALAHVDGRVCAIIEPIALYMTKDLYEPKDQLWSFNYPAPGEVIPLGEGKVYPSGAVGPAFQPVSPSVQSEPRPSGSGAISELRPLGSGQTQATKGDDLTILTFANGVHMSLRAAKTLREQHGIHARVVDLRWLNPLNESFIIEQSLATKRVLVVDESRRTGGVAESILALLYEAVGTQVHAQRLNALDTYVPLGPAADLVLPTEKDVVTGAIDLLNAGIAPAPHPIKPAKSRGK